MTPSESKHTPYLLFILALSLFALLLLGASVVLPMSSETRQILDYADDILCAAFFVDFLLTLWRAENRWRYFLRWGWIDLLSCIPSVDYFRAGRAARIFRAFRVLRAIRSAKVIATFILQRRAQSAALAALLMTVLLVVLASIGILQFEDVADANIKTAEDALWWTMATITTVGYGDRYPVTTEGRALAVGLMVAGVGLAGIYTGYVAAWFLRPSESLGDDKDARLDDIASTLARMDVEAIENLDARLVRLQSLLRTKT